MIVQLQVHPMSRNSPTLKKTFRQNYKTAHIQMRIKSSRYFIKQDKKTSKK